MTRADMVFIAYTIRNMYTLCNIFKSNCNVVMTFAREFCKRDAIWREHILNSYQFGIVKLVLVAVKTGVLFFMVPVIKIHT